MRITNDLKESDLQQVFSSSKIPSLSHCPNRQTEPQNHNNCYGEFNILHEYFNAKKTEHKAKTTAPLNKHILCAPSASHSHVSIGSLRVKIVQHNTLLFQERV